MLVQVQLRRDTLANVLANHGAPGRSLYQHGYERSVCSGRRDERRVHANGTSPARAATAVDAAAVPIVSHGGNIQFACQEQLLTGLSRATAVSTIMFPNPCPDSWVLRTSHDNDHWRDEL